MFQLLEHNNKGSEEFPASGQIACSTAITLWGCVCVCVCVCVNVMIYSLLKNRIYFNIFFHSTRLMPLRRWLGGRQKTQGRHQWWGAKLMLISTRCNSQVVRRVDTVVFILVRTLHLRWNFSPCGFVKHGLCYTSKGICVLVIWMYYLIIFFCLCESEEICAIILSQYLRLQSRHSNRNQHFYCFTFSFLRKYVINLTQKNTQTLSSCIVLALIVQKYTFSQELIEKKKDIF